MPSGVGEPNHCSLGVLRNELGTGKLTQGVKALDLQYLAGLDRAPATDLVAGSLGSNTQLLGALFVDQGHDFGRVAALHGMGKLLGNMHRIGRPTLPAPGEQHCGSDNGSHDPPGIWPENEQRPHELSSLPFRKPNRLSNSRK